MPPQTSPPRFAVFLDAALPDLAMLLPGIPGDGVGIEIPPDADALPHMARALAELCVGPEGLEELGIVAHGGPGRLTIGRHSLTTPLLRAQAPTLREIGCCLRLRGRMRLMGCNVAAGARGQEFGVTMARLLGRPVVAATGTLGDGRAEFDAIFEA